MYCMISENTRVLLDASKREFEVKSMLLRYISVLFLALKELQVIEQTSSIYISAVFYSSLEFPPRDFASRHTRLTEQQGKLSKGS